MKFKHTLLLAIAWLGMQLFIINQYGIVTVNEAGKYINQASLLTETGHLSHPSMWLYAIEILLIAATKMLGTGYLPVVLVQLFFSGMAVFFFYRLCLELSTAKTALVITLLLIFNYNFQAFNTYLYTESLFFSFTILLTCYLFQLRELKIKNILVLLLLLLVICFTRPSGLLFVPAVLIYIFGRFVRNWAFTVKAGLVAAVSATFLFILNLAIGSGGELDFMLPYREEHIICGVPTIKGIGFDSGENSILGILSYVIDHPIQATRLAWSRSLAFFGLFRSYYSLAHNIYLAVYFFPVYLLVILGLKDWWKQNRAVLSYCLALVTITWGTVMLTCDDWHNRFFLSIVPYLYLLALPATRKMISRITRTS